MADPDGGLGPLFERVESMRPIRGLVEKDMFNETLEALATSRATHRKFAQDYIARWEDDPNGTGGTPYLE